MLSVSPIEDRCKLVLLGCDVLKLILGISLLEPEAVILIDDALELRDNGFDTADDFLDLFLGLLFDFFLGLFFGFLELFSEVRESSDRDQDLIEAFLTSDQVSHRPKDLLSLRLNIGLQFSIGLITDVRIQFS